MLDELGGVLARVLHGGHARGVLGRGGFEKCMPNLILDVARDHGVIDFRRGGLVDVIELFLGFLERELFDRQEPKRMTLWKHTNVGRVVQVIGNVIDVEFANGQLPAIFNALRVVDEGKLSTHNIEVTVEVQQHLGENRVRAVAMQPTDGLVRGMTVLC